MAEQGRFISFEGGEGAGKSTQIGMLRQALERAGLSVVQTREPGGTPGAEEIRRLIVGGEAGRWDALTESLLDSAARRNHLAEKIVPALESGSWVLTDRFADSTLAYQGYAGGVPLADLAALYRMVAGDLRPDLTIILDLPVEAGLGRAKARGGTGEDRFERMALAFHEKLRRGFLAIAEAEPERCVVIDSTRPVAEVHATIMAASQQRLGFPR